MVDSAVQRHAPLTSVVGAPSVDFQQYTRQGRAHSRQDPVLDANSEEIGRDESRLLA